ncbi:MAG: hypothetical protein HQL12_08250 [Candidatus Omnitrophica bacterium]|nr:hypothetical protein [Candidatus Omnitrophota bacterium]
MNVAFEFILINLVIFGSLFLFLRWVCTQSATWRNVTAFVVELGSAYSASFVFDMLVQAITGRLQFDNVVAPVCTWSGIAIACHFFASGTAVSKKPLYLAYLILGLIATAACFIHTYNLIVGVSLLVIAGVIALIPRNNSPRI